MGGVSGVGSVPEYSTLIGQQITTRPSHWSLLEVCWLRESANYRAGEREPGTSGECCLFEASVTMVEAS